MNKSKVVKEEKREKEFKLPRYLRLDKGSMFFDEGDELSSGVRIFAVKKIFIGRKTELEKYLDEKGEEKLRAKITEIPKDEFDNKNISDYGKVDSTLPWYFDTTKIPTEKLSRIVTAFKYGILVEADPENPPEEKKPKEPLKDFGYKENGDRIFTGKNKDVYAKLQNMNFAKIREFVNSAPLTETSRNNLMDMYAYEVRGYNPLNRARQEVLDLLKKKLKEFGPGISSIRLNED